MSPTTAPELNEIEINGHKAFQWKVHFIDSDKIHCTATVTCLATQRYLVELQDCTYESKFAASLTELRGILATIRESTTDRAQSGGSQKQPEPNSRLEGITPQKYFVHPTTRLKQPQVQRGKVYSANCQGTTLHISDPLEQKVIQVATYLRSTSGSDLKGFAAGEAQRFAQYAPGAKVSDPKETEINGHKAIQWEVHWIGPENNFRWGGVITCFATHRYFAEVRALAQESKFKESVSEVAELCSHNSRSASANPPNLRIASTKLGRTL